MFSSHATGLCPKPTSQEESQRSADPVNATAPEEEMAATSHLPPYGRRKGHGSIPMLSN